MTISKFHNFLKPTLGKYGSRMLALSYQNYKTKDVVLNTRKTGFTTVFDVSHMGIFETSISDQSINKLNSLLNIDLNKLQNNKSKLSVILNNEGYVMDDLIISNVDDNKFRLVVNSENKDFFRNLNFLDEQNKSIIALQGDGSQDALESMFNFNLDDIYFMENKYLSSGFEICRCGYTWRRWI